MTLVRLAVLLIVMAHAFTNVLSVTNEEFQVGIFTMQMTDVGHLQFLTFSICSGVDPGFG